MWGFSRQQLIFLGIAGIIVIVFLAILFSGGRKEVERVNLTIWGVDDKLAWDYAIFRYQQTHPGVRLEYTEFDPTIYEKELINALAAGRGPDIFMLNNRWAPKHADKIIPMPEGKMAVSTFSSFFPQVAEQDFLTSEGQIYALPLSIDTLALFYNRDIFDRGGVALPPKTWEEFLSIIPQLRISDRVGNLTLTAAAIGGSGDNISNAPDILELLMLQTGALSPEEFPSETIRSEEGEKALEFYTQFVNRQSPYYTWSTSSPQAFDSFAEGKTAMVFAYANDIPEIQAKNPFLKFAIEPTPQNDLNNAISIANYWGLTVSTKSQKPDAAWDFILSTTTDIETASYYLTSTKRPPALRPLIDKYLNDINLGAFARQALTARSFYQGDDAAIWLFFNKAIQKAIAGNSTFEILEELEAEFASLGSPKK